MKWAYIAGFFDGEGNVGMPLGHNCPLLNITQAGDVGRLLLEEIKDFLATEGIHCRIESVSIVLNHKPCYRIRMNAGSVVAFLVKVMPYLRIKRTIAQDVLRARKMFPSLTKGPVGKFFRQELSARVNEPRKVATCFRGHVKVIGPRRAWCRECMKSAYRDKVEEKANDNSRGRE